MIYDRVRRLIVGLYSKLSLQTVPVAKTSCRLGDPV